MTAPTPSAFAKVELEQFNRLRSDFARREKIANTIHEIRQGNIRQLFPDELDWSLSFDGPATANFIDIVARDMAEGIAPLPALACVSGKMESQADQNRAIIKNRIGENYWINSKLELQMLRAADQFISYGFVPLFIEPDNDLKLPRITALNPRGSYYEVDRAGRTVTFAHVYRKTAGELCALYPEWAPVIKYDPKTGQECSGNERMELIMWVDKTSVQLLLPSRNGLRIASYDHKLSRLPVAIVERPGEADHPRGQFDDVVWVQVARAVTAALLLEAQAKAVQAPIAVPDDMTEIPVGPDSVLQSSNAKDIHRIDLQVPNGIFAEAQVLDQELRVGSRYPEARSGDPGTSVITGKGVEALLGAFDSQIKGAQLVWKYALQDATSICFEMDEVWWPSATKTVNGTISGRSFEFTYTAAQHIAGRWDCTVTYGFAAGLKPEQSSIMMLQLAGAGMISKSTVQSNMPFSIDQQQEERQIHVERLRDGLEQGVLSLLASSGQMAAQGQDALGIVKMSVDMIRAVQTGQMVEDAIEQAFETMQQAQQAQQEQAQQAMAQAQAAGGDQQGGDQGPATDQAQQAQTGQAGMPPGGKVPLQQLIAGFRGDGSTPVLQTQIKRQVPVAG